MNTWLKTMLGLMLMQAGGAWAADSPWTLRLGASYRSFDDVAFKGINFRNSGKALNPVGPYGVQDATAAPDNLPGTAVILDCVRWNGGSEAVDNDDRLAPVIGFGYGLTQVGKIRLALVGNFQYYHMAVGSSARGSAVAPDGFSLEQDRYYVGADPGTLLPVVPFDDVGAVVPGTTFAVRNKFDMDLYVLDLGLEAATTMGRVNFTLALGPSLTIADAESSQWQQASWLPQGPGSPPPPPIEPCPPNPPSLAAGGSYARKKSDSDTKFLPGAYAALGVTVDLSKSWFVGLEYRYDYVHGDAGTSQAKLDLSGSSGILSLNYRF